ncbi:MAG: PTS sugar transporter subunit IIA [Candidatus Aminicenantes bacterium]|nr:PTS sugar transporter subunit IIA [Candidatus Aminicenantes bacterium]MDH5383348.1 PTS sugar transporter subunit IIA [Candidatus Aminicenantes bacterium]MDH5743298.1 PTS sugar transporter subunit IIA [Candidatus Aminicenantes bacterium]
MKIQNLLMQDMIMLELGSEKMEDVLHEMVGFLKKRNMITKEKELYERLIQRERLGSTAIGDGVAIPHCKIKGVRDPILMLAVSKKGVNFYSVDGKPTYVFFLVVSSPDNPSLNLQILAAIAHLVRKANSLLKKISEANNISEILDIIREEEEKINE